MTDRIEVDYEAMLAAVRREAEMWRTAKDRMAERAEAAEAALLRVNEAAAVYLERAEAAEARADAAVALLRDILDPEKTPDQFKAVSARVRAFLETEGQ